MTNKEYELLQKGFTSNEGIEKALETILGSETIRNSGILAEIYKRIGANTPPKKKNARDVLIKLGWFKEEGGKYEFVGYQYDGVTRNATKAEEKYIQDQQRKQLTNEEDEQRDQAAKNLVIGHENQEGTVMTDDLVLYTQEGEKKVGRLDGVSKRRGQKGNLRIRPITFNKESNKISLQESIININPDDYISPVRDDDTLTDINWDHGLEDTDKKWNKDENISFKQWNDSIVERNRRRAAATKARPGRPAKVMPDATTEEMEDNVLSGEDKMDDMLRAEKEYKFYYLKKGSMQSKTIQGKSPREALEAARGKWKNDVARLEYEGKVYQVEYDDQGVFISGNKKSEPEPEPDDDLNVQIDGGFGVAVDDPLPEDEPSGSKQKKSVRAAGQEVRKRILLTERDGTPIGENQEVKSHAISVLLRDGKEERITETSQQKVGLIFEDTDGRIHVLGARVSKRKRGDREYKVVVVEDPKRAKPLSKGGHGQVAFVIEEVNREPFIHIVKEGETLDSIAGHYGLEAGDITADREVSAGDKVLIPESRPTVALTHSPVDSLTTEAYLGEERGGYLSSARLAEKLYIEGGGTVMVGDVEETSPSDPLSKYKYKLIGKIVFGDTADIRHVFSNQKTYKDSLDAQTITSARKIKKVLVGGGGTGLGAPITTGDGDTRIAEVGEMEDEEQLDAQAFEDEINEVEGEEILAGEGAETIERLRSKLIRVGNIIKEDGFKSETLSAFANALGIPGEESTVQDFVDAILNDKVSVDEAAYDSASVIWEKIEGQRDKTEEEEPRSAEPQIGERSDSENSLFRRLRTQMLMDDSHANKIIDGLRKLRETIFKEDGLEIDLAGFVENMVFQKTVDLDAFEGLVLGVITDASLKYTAKQLLMEVRRDFHNWNTAKRD